MTTTHKENSIEPKPNKDKLGWSKFKKFKIILAITLIELALFIFVI